MEIRYKLDPQLDAEMIADILTRANGGSPSKAAYLLAVERAAVISATNPTLQRQNHVGFVADTGQNTDSPQETFSENIDSTAAAIADINALW